MAITVYCFCTARWGDDVVAVAVCSACSGGISSHVSSNDDWAKRDITSEYHVREYARHAHDVHSSDEPVAVVWLDKPNESAELRALFPPTDNPPL